MSAELHVLAPRDGLTVGGILETAKTCEMVECLIIGSNADGEFVFLNSGVSLRDALWLTEKARDSIMGRI